jgi:putative ABC transport system ATP-binding protein
MEIRMDGIGKSYRSGERQQVIFENLTATFASGRISAIMGKSGVGKSTLLNLIAGIDHPDVGELCVGGRHVASLSEEARCRFRREHIGFVFQFFHLISVLTVEENVMMVSELSGFSPTEARARAVESLAEVGLAGKEKTYPELLSGGERQRVSIARALSADPALILADEPTGNLDGETGRIVMDLFTSLVRQKGKTVVVVTHSRETASVCDALFEVRDHGLHPFSLAATEASW